MSDKLNNYRDNHNNTTKTPINIEEEIDEQLNNTENQNNKVQTEESFNTRNAIQEEQYELNKKLSSKKADKPLKVFGAVCITIAIFSFIYSGTSTTNTSQSAKNALKDKVSTSISAGTILLSKDENAQAKDYTISHKSDVKDTKIWLWDYAAEDGDYVQVLVDGAPVGDAFMIKHKPKEITVPAVGKVQIKGIRDGGGGITYAVRYDINGTSYFNGTPEGEFNTYTLTK